MMMMMTMMIDNKLDGRKGLVLGGVGGGANVIK